MHPTDEWLRRHGFKIASRPSRGPVLWTRGDYTYTEAEARFLCKNELEALEKAGR